MQCLTPDRAQDSRCALFLMKSLSRVRQGQAESGAVVLATAASALARLTNPAAQREREKERETDRERERERERADRRSDNATCKSNPM